MGSIMNGMAAHGAIIPFGGTFLTFSDYMRPAIRLAALMNLQSIFVFTHDSIALGEDGPTHQPIEQVSSLRAIPHLQVIRPADANETAYAWKVAIESRTRPTALILSRQNLPTLDRKQYASAENVTKGAYVLKDAENGKPDIILMASGSEVALIIEAAEQLKKEGLQVRLVSFPCWELFEAQDKAYQEAVLPKSVTRRLAVEAGVPQGWERYVGGQGDIIGIDQFGVSAPADEALKHFGFTAENVVSRAKALSKQ
jgi:transketolase